MPRSSAPRNRMTSPSNPIPSNPVTLRPMQAADLEAVLALAAALQEAPHWPRAAYQDALNPAAAVQRVALVAEAGGELLGFVVASLLAPEAELESIAVARGAQRRGVGRILLAELCCKIGQFDVLELRLEVRAGNLQAIAFYQATGWTACGRRPRYYVDPVEDALLLLLTLPKPSLSQS
ncbi:GNAT family N-acetyltransferase [Telmatobacter bradus]|uniref:GNAT family N-acetyltransferase n=1 Tax=Telmatobacter bradus TaxID=474953 RepID=UPI003B4351D2